MNIEDKKQQINALMTEYSQLKCDPANRGRCIAIKNQVATLMFHPSGIVFKYLCKTAKNRSQGYPTRYEPDEFVTETFLKYFNEYNCDISDNFLNYFMYFLKCTVSNMIKREHPDHYPTMPTYTDDEGNEIDIAQLTPDGEANPETIAFINQFNSACGEEKMQVLFDESISEEEAETRMRFIEYISQIIPCINQANEHRGKRNDYYRAFATDFYIAACKWRLHSRYNMNENEAFQSMDKKFADRTLTDVCRSFTEFERTPCKTYAEIGLTGRNYATGEIETPFKNGVYTVYFEVTDGAVSQKRGEFHSDIGKLVSKER